MVLTTTSMRALEYLNIEAQMNVVRKVSHRNVIVVESPAAVSGTNPLIVSLIVIFAISHYSIRDLQKSIGISVDS